MIVCVRNVSDSFHWVHRVTIVNWFIQLNGWVRTKDSVARYFAQHIEKLCSGLPTSTIHLPLQWVLHLHLTCLHACIIMMAAMCNVNATWQKFIISVSLAKHAGESNVRFSYYDLFFSIVIHFLYNLMCWPFLWCGVLHHFPLACSVLMYTTWEHRLFL